MHTNTSKIDWTGTAKDGAIAALVSTALPSIEQIEKMMTSEMNCVKAVPPCSLEDACWDVGLSHSRVNVDHEFDFSKCGGRSVFDQHALETLGNVIHQGNSIFDASHIIKIDQKLKGSLRGQHVLYHELAHCIVYEMRIQHSKKLLDSAWNEAFAEVLAFYAVLLRNGRNNYSLELWTHYKNFKASGGACAVLDAYRNNRVFSNREAHDMWYNQLRWVLFEAISVLRRFDSLEDLLEQLIHTNGNSDIWLTAPHSIVDAARPESSQHESQALVPALSHTSTYKTLGRTRQIKNKPSERENGHATEASSTAVVLESSEATFRNQTAPAPALRIPASGTDINPATISKASSGVQRNDHTGSATPRRSPAAEKAAAAAIARENGCSAGASVPQRDNSAILQVAVMVGASVAVPAVVWCAIRYRYSR